jgi:hypothetical protein
MVNYENAVIYKICCKDPTITDNYIGSTTDYKNIKINHKSNCNNQYSRYHNRYVYEFIRKHQGWSNWRIRIVKRYPDITSKKELLKKHRKWMRVLGASLNQRVPGTVIKVGKRKYDKLYYESHREENAEYYREYNKYYRETHYLQIKSKARKSIECECGCTIKQCSMTYHKNSKKHFSLLKEITNSNII